MASLSPVSLTKLTVAWNLLASFRTSSVSITPSLLSCVSIPSSARSIDSQKLISCEAVPDDGSRVRRVVDWIALIQVETVC